MEGGPRKHNLSGCPEKTLGSEEEEKEEEAGWQVVSQFLGRKVNGRKEGTGKSRSFVCVVAVAADSVRDVGGPDDVLNFRKYNSLLRPK